MGFASDIRQLSDRIFCEDNAQKPCLTEHTRFRVFSLTYGEVRERILACETWLENHAIAKGDRVIICAGNGNLRAALYFACARLGIVMVPLDAHSTQDFARKIAEETRAKAAFTSAVLPLSFPGTLHVSLEQLGEELRSVKPKERTYADLHADDLLQIVYTSGTTGDPKGVMLTHGNIAANVEATLAHISVRQGHTLLSILPMSHMLEQTVGFLVPLMNGASITYPALLTPLSISRALKEEGITCIVCVPAFLRMIRDAVERKRTKNTIVHLGTNLLINTAKRLPQSAIRSYTFPLRSFFVPRLELLITGGAPADASVIDWWESLGIKVLQGYGLTEASPIVAGTPLHRRRRDAIGTFLGNVEYRLTDENELLLRGPSITQGYYKNPEATATAFTSDGWYRTGDIVEVDDEGFLQIKGRTKNMILSSSGVNVYPEDIESVLNAHPYIQESVVLGVLCDGDIRIDAWVLIDDARFCADDILHDCNGSLAPHQRIDRLQVWPEADFPRTNTRKIKRKEAAVIAAKQGGGAASIGTTADALLNILCSVCAKDPSVATDSANLADDLGFDSLMKLVLLSRLEEELLVSIDDALLNPRTTVADLRRLVSENKKTQNRAEPRWPSRACVRFVRTRVLQPILLTLFRLRMKSVRCEKIAMPDEPSIFIANHASHLDVLAILSACEGPLRERLRFAAAQDYFFASRFKSFFVRLALGAFPWNRSAGLRANMKRFGSLMDRGENVLIFPEGTRSATGKLQNLQTGIGVLALAMNARVIPLHIAGTFEALAKGKTRITPAHIRVTAGEPYRANPLCSAPEVMRELQEIMKRMEQESQKHPASA